MGDVLTSILAFIVAIGVLVAVHEYGHYIVGRWTGMKVLRYSIGFGKPLVTWVRGKDQTEYCISAIPLGGYVRFLDGREGPVDPADEGRAFDHRPVWARILVLLAGPLFNFLFAIAAYWVLFVGGIPTMIPAVGDVAEGSYAESAGLEFGDKIVEVGDVATSDWESTLVNIFAQVSGDGRVLLTLEDTAGDRRSAVIDVGDDARSLTEPDRLFDGLGFRPWRPPAVIGELTEGGSAGPAGLQVGDRVISVDEQPVQHAGELISAVAGRAGETAAIEVMRDGRSVSYDVAIRPYEVDGETIGRIGVSLSASNNEYYYLRKFGPLESISHATERMWNSSVFTVTMLARMVTGDVSVKNISGPINIAQFAGDSAERGLSDFLGFLALVSISLGVLNLMPIPILDGGQIVYQTIEWIKGAPLSEQAQIVGQQVGIFALLLLMSFAFYNDIARILG